MSDDPNYPPTTAPCVPVEGDYSGASCPPEYEPVTTVPSTRTGAPLADTGADLGWAVHLAIVLLIFGIVALAAATLQRTKARNGVIT